MLAERTSIALDPEEASRFLAALDDPARFETGLGPLTERLRAYAGQGQRRDTARTFVVCRKDQSDVVGYYTLVASQVKQSEVTDDVRQGTSKQFPIPSA